MPKTNKKHTPKQQKKLKNGASNEKLDRLLIRGGNANRDLECSAA
jgi:hypothetical protein